MGFVLLRLGFCHDVFEALCRGLVALCDSVESADGFVQVELDVCFNFHTLNLSQIRDSARDFLHLNFIDYQGLTEAYKNYLEK